MKVVIPFALGSKGFYKKCLNALVKTIDLNDEGLEIKLVVTDSELHETLLSDGAFDWYEGELREHMARNLVKTVGQYVFLTDYDGERDSEVFCFLDADTIVTSQISDIQERDFDFAYTVRSVENMKDRAFMCPFNCGVLFCRNTSKVASVLAEMRSMLIAMSSSEELHQKWCSKYYGIQQAVWGWFLEERAKDFKVLQLPCEIWNCEDSSWHKFDRYKTKVAHIKGALRIMCDHGVEPGDPKTKEIYDLFQLHSGE